MEKLETLYQVNTRKCTGLLVDTTDINKAVRVTTNYILSTSDDYMLIAIIRNNTIPAWYEVNIYPMCIVTINHIDETTTTYPIESISEKTMFEIFNK